MARICRRVLFSCSVVGLGEETGWGFSLPELQKSYSPLLASLVIAVFWAARHIPLMGIEFKGGVIPPFLVSVAAGSVVLAWLFNRAKGGLLPIPVLHATVNTIGTGYVFPMFVAGENIRLWWIYALLWVIAAVVLVLRSPMMSRKPSAAH